MDESMPVLVDIEQEEMTVEQTEFDLHLRSMKATREAVHEIAASNIRKAQARQKKDYESRHGVKTTFQIGQKVLVFNLR